MIMKNLPIDTNMRAANMWRTISQRVDFRGKTVIDLGCGTGDFLWRARVAGADTVVGLDKSQDRIQEISKRFEHTKMDHIPNMILPDFGGSIGVGVYDLNKYSEFLRPENKVPTFKIAMCFSVLPYLDDMAGFLAWMANSFPLCLIEAQYRPEPYNVGKSNDTQMAQLLIDCGFNKMEPIGATYVGIRDAWRTIWMTSK